MSVAVDVVVVSSIASTLAGITSIPQFVKVVREPESLQGLALSSLLLQVVVATMFAYINLRLGLLLATTECVVSLCFIGAICWMKIAALRTA